jgi:hypothetical protein
VGSTAIKMRFEISKGPLTHSDDKGMGSAAMTDAAATLVTVDGSSAPITEAPGADAVIDNASSSASAMIVGGNDRQCGFKASSLKIGMKHVIQVTLSGVVYTYDNTLRRVITSDLAEADTVLEIGGANGPLSPEITAQAAKLAALGSKLTKEARSAFFGLNVGLMEAGTAARQLTNETGGAIILAYENEMIFPTALQSTIDSIRVFTGSDNVEVNLHSAVAGSVALANTSNFHKRVNVYSFALKPEEHQPSGTCNFSRIDNAQLDFEVAPGSDGNIYAVNYNVLRIMSGMGGLAYSN